MAKKSSLGSLLINLELQTATLNKQVGQINKKFDGMTKTFKRVGVALAGVFAVREFTGMINNTLKLNDALGKTADRLGLTVEQLQGFQFGAEQSGVSMATFEMALQRMTRRISEAGQGTGEAVKALKEMGIEADKLSMMSVNDQLGVLADALSGVENEADQVRLAMKLFDSEGVKLLNMLQGGADGLNAYQREARALGFVLSREMIAKMEQANDSMNRASKVGQMYKNMMAVAVAPAIKAVSEQFVSFVTNTNGANETLTTMQSIVASVVQGFDILFHSVRTAMAGWVNAFNLLAVAKVKLLGTDEELLEALTAYNDGIDQSRNKFKALSGAILGFSPVQIALNKAFTEAPPAIEKINDSYTELISQTKKTEDSFKDIKFVFTNAFSGMESGIVDFAKTGKASFSDFASSVMSDLLKMIIRLQITIPLMNALQASMGGGGMLSGLFGFAKGGAISGGVQQFASGGIVNTPTRFPMAGGTGIMGEAGAEAIIPLTRTSNGDLGVKAVGGGGAVTVVNIYNQSGADTEVTETQGGDGGKQIDIMIKSSVERSIGNGGLDKALGTNFGLSRQGF